MSIGQDGMVVASKALALTAVDLSRTRHWCRLREPISIAN